MLRFVIDSGRAAGIEISLCGEMGADPRFALLLVGMGLRRISMSPRRIPEIKTWLRDVTAAELAELAESCLAYGTAADVQRHLDGFFECSTRQGTRGAAQGAARTVRN
jgi:phosphotransferase system enzyme I (PtsP)